MLFACKDNNIRNLTVKFEAVELPLGGKLIIDNYISYEGESKGKLNYAVENLDVLTISDNVVSAIGRGTGKVVVSSEDETVSFNVIVVDKSAIDIKVSNISTNYDTTLKNIDVELSQIPDGTKINYYCDDNKVDGFVNPGTYEITVEVIAPNGYKVNYINNKATLIIDKGIIDIGNIEFKTTRFIYDGTKKVLEVKGELPQQVQVSYTNNFATNTGTYKASAIFSVDTNLYYVPTSRSAQLIIEKQRIEYSTLGFANKSVFYNGNYQYIAFNDQLEGFKIEYSIWDDAQNDYIAIENLKQRFINVGNYKIRATLVKENDVNNNYTYDNEQIATLEIKKVDYINNMNWTQLSNLTYNASKSIVVEKNSNNTDNIQYLYLDGDNNPTGVNGEHSEDISIEYYFRDGTTDRIIDNTNKTFINAGKYIIVAKFYIDKPDSNYNDIEDRVYTINISKSNYFNLASGETLPIVYNNKSVEFDNNAITFAKDESKYPIKDINNNIIFNNFDEQYPNFATDVKIFYSYNKDGMGYTDPSEIPCTIKDVGFYACKAAFSYSATNSSDNYNIIPTRNFEINITPKEVDLSGVIFESTSVDYDPNSSHSMAITSTLPEGVTVVYSNNNSQINAGTYSIVATLSYKMSGVAIANSNYCFVNNNNLQNNQLTAFLIIKKINYLPGQIPTVHTAGGQYSPNKKLSNYYILLSDDSISNNFYWTLPNTIPTVTIASYNCYYNAYPTNYYNHYLDLALAITPLEIDKANIEIQDQFLPFTGNTVKPVFSIDGDTNVNNILTFSTQEGEALSAIGNHNVTALFALADSNNFSWVDSAPEPKSISLYIYNTAKFNYAINSTQLIDYLSSSPYEEIMEGTTSIYNNAIKNKAGLEGLILPSTLISISNGAIDIDTLPKLNKVTIPYLGTVLGAYEPLGAIFGKNNNELPISLKNIVVTNETNISNNAYNGCQYLESINYTNSVSSIGDNAFSGCLNVKTINFGESITDLGTTAFHYCYELLSLSLPFVGSNASSAKQTMSYLIGTNVGDNSYNNYKLNSFTLYGSWTTLPNNMFAGMSNMTSLTLPTTLISIGEKCFDGVVADILLNDNFTTITRNMFYNYQGSTLVLPSGTCIIEPYAFCKADKITNLTLPSAVNSIGEYAFQEFSGTILFADNSSLINVVDNAFRYAGFTHIALPSSVTTIGEYAFANSKLLIFTLPDAITSLGVGAFSNCDSLTTISLGISILPNKVLQDCDSLTSVNLYNTTTIGEYAFNSCDSLQSIILPITISDINNYAFYECNLLDNVIIVRDNGLVNFVGNNVFDKETNILVADPYSYKLRYGDIIYTFITK